MNLTKLREYLETSTTSDIVEGYSTFSRPLGPMRRVKYRDNFDLADYRIEDIIDILYELGRYDVLENILMHDKENYFGDRKYDLINKLGYIPTKYINDLDVFNYYASKGDFDIAVTFNFYLNPMPQYDKELHEAALRRCLSLSPDDYYTNKYIMEAYIELDRFDIIYLMKRYRLCNVLENNEIFFNRCILDKQFKFLFYFDRSLITEEIISKYIDELFNEIVCGNAFILGDSPTLLNKCIKEKRFDLLESFNEKTLTEDIISKHAEDIVKVFSNTVPQIFFNSKSILDGLIKQERFDLILYMDSSLLTENILMTYYDKYEKYLVDLRLFFPANKFADSKFLFYKYLSSKKYNMLNYFNDKFFTDDIIDNNIDEILEFFKYDYTDFPSALKDNKKVLDRAVYLGIYNIIPVFSEDLLKQGDYISILFTLPYVINLPYDSAFFFNKCVEYKKFNLAVNFSDFLSDDFIREYFNDIYSQSDSSCPYSLRNNKTYFDLVLENGYMEYIFTFDRVFLTETFINDNLGKIFEYWKDKDCLPYRLKDSSIFFDKCLKEKCWKLLIDFNEELFTDEVINNNYLNFIQYFSLTDVKHSSSLLLNRLFFEKCLQENKITLVCSFLKDFFTKELVDKYFQDILVIMDIKFPVVLVKNEYLFEKCLENKRFDLLIKFNKSFFTKKIVDDYYSEIIEAIGDYLPYELKENRYLFDKCIETNNIKLALDFSSDFFTSELLTEKYSIIYEYIINKKFVPFSLINSELLFNQFLKEKNLYLLFSFNESLFTKELISSNLDSFYEYIVKYHTLPRALIKSSELFDKCILNKKYDILFLFDSVFFTDKFLEEKFDEIINNIDNVPYVLKFNNFFFNLCITKKCLNLLPLFSYDLDVNQDNLNIIIDEYNKGDKELVFALCNNSKLSKKLMSLGAHELILYFKFNTEIYMNDLIDCYAQVMNISVEELKNKINYLLSKNDEILDTLYPMMLSKRFEIIPLKCIEKLGLYKDIQSKLIKLNDNNLKFIARVLSVLDSSQYDLNSVIYDVLNNLSGYQSLINQLDLDSLTEQNIKDLIYVIRNNNNIFEINNLEDLNSFNRKKSNYFMKIQEKIDNKTIDIIELKQGLLELKYGLSLEMAEFIFNRYCSDLVGLKKSVDNEGFSHSIYSLLLDIASIYKSNSVDKLSYLWELSDVIETDYLSTIALESAIRKEYAAMYSNSLYKLNEEHKLNEKSSLYSKNREIYDQLMNASYNDKKPQFYILDGDFNLQIHVLGAYRLWSRPKNFKQDWERPKIAYHGICTSYIGNDQIANARITHPVYGFDSYEESALLAAGNYDLFSDHLISKFASSVYQPHCLYPPQLMIDKTRHSHNEFVIERRNGRDDSSFKRIPSYVIYFVDDINNVSNFDSNNELFSETVQAAVDQNIPIVIVDRLKYAKYEFGKCIELKNEFYKTNSFDYLAQLFTKMCNNMVGCRKYDTQEVSQYHDVFSDKVLDEWFNEIFTYAVSLNDIRFMKLFLNFVRKEATMLQYVSIIENHINDMINSKSVSNSEEKRL